MNKEFFFFLSILIGKEKIGEGKGEDSRGAIGGKAQGGDAGREGVAESPGEGEAGSEKLPLDKLVLCSPVPPRCVSIFLFPLSQEQLESGRPEGLDSSAQPPCQQPRNPAALRKNSRAEQI